MVLGITLFSPALILLTPEHHCLIKANVTEDSPSPNGSCYLQYPTEVNVSYNSGYYNSLEKKQHFESSIVCLKWWLAQKDGSTIPMDYFVRLWKM